MPARASFARRTRLLPRFGGRPWFVSLNKYDVFSDKACTLPFAQLQVAMAAQQQLVANLGGAAHAIAASFTAFAQHVDEIGHLPVLEQANQQHAQQQFNQQVLEALLALGAQLTAQINGQGAQLSARIDAQGAQLTAQINALGAQLSARIDAQGVQLATLDLNACRNFNRSADMREALRWPVYKLGAHVPADLQPPLTYRDVARADSATIDALLLAYGIQVEPGMHPADKCAALMQYIGRYRPE